MSEETAALRELIADLAASHAGATSPQELQEAWAGIRDVGVDSIGVSEDAGGSGGTLAHLAVVASALGEKGMGLPVIEAATARWVLASAGAAINASLPIVVLTDADEQPRVLVPWGRHADLLVVYLSNGDALAYDLTDAQAGVAEDVNLAGEPRDTITLDGIAARRLESAPSVEAVRARLGLLWAAALAGAMRGAYHKTRDHVREREQFGGPLIKIPAVAGALANFKTQLLLAEVAVARAVDSLGDDGECPDTASVAAARIVTASGATEAARLAHQLHGAMGVTEEGGLHRLSTRLWAWQDAVTSERAWSIELGEQAIDGGEEQVWSVLTPAF